jgi:hypothetical protein
MKNHFFKLSACGVVALVLGVIPLNAATYISGEIAFTGGATMNGPLGSATAFSSFFGPTPGSGPAVILATGDYSAIPIGTAATFTPFTFNPQPLVSAELWTVSFGGITYSFDLTSVQIEYQSANFLNIKGTGVAHVTGFDPTPGTWSIADGGFSGIPVVTFGSVAVVPEPSTAAFICAAGLMLFSVKRIRGRN